MSEANTPQLHSLNPALKTWLTTKEAAEYLGTTPGAIRNQVWRGRLKTYRRKGIRSSYFKRQELDWLLESSPKGGF